MGILTCSLFLLGIANGALAARIFSLGDKVSVTSPVNVRTASSTSALVIGRQNIGVSGVITEISTKTVGGYWWYKIDFENSTVDGWSVQDYLKLYTAPVVADTVKPAVPTALTATPISSSKIELAWTVPADTDIAGYHIYRDKATAPSVTVPKAICTECKYTDINLIPSHSYSYQIAAYDNSGNISHKSTAISVTTPAVIGAMFSTDDKISVTSSVSVRSTPGIYGAYLDKQPEGASGIIVSGPITKDGYIWWQVNYDSGADGWSVQNYLKPYTAPVTADTTKPTAPTLTVTPSSTKVDLSWSGATDNTGVTGYKVYRGTTQIATVANTAYSDTAVAPAAAYSYYVMAMDAAGNLSPKSNTISVTTPAVGGAAFTDGAHIITTEIVNVRSTPSTTGSVIDKKPVGAKGQILSGPVSANGYLWWQVNYNGGTKGWTIQNYLKIDSGYGVTVDRTAPTTPTNLTDTVVTNGVQLDWTASTDADSGIGGYKIYRGATLIATTVGSSVTYTDTTVTPQHGYSYQVAAYDVAGNTSIKSAVSTGRAGTVVDALFNRSDRISTIEVVNVRSSAGIYKPVKGRQAVGMTGTILSGPIIIDGYNWWEVNYDSGVDGWTVESYMKKI